MYKNSSTFIPVHEPDLNYKDLKSVYKTIKKGEISGSFTSTIKEFEKNDRCSSCYYGIFQSDITIWN